MYIASSMAHRLQLIHRHSIISPYYNPSSSVLDRAHWMVESSETRAKIIESFSDDEGAINLPIITNNIGVFLVNVSLGTPPVWQLVVMDTGSDLFWIHCSPCTNCDRNPGPMFDPLLSSTYRNLTCSSPFCAGSALLFRCDFRGYCLYTKIYGDETTSESVLALENLNFVLFDGEPIASRVIFGCAHKVSEDSGRKFRGILGLSYRNVSLVSRFGSLFSYCIGNISDPNYINNMLIIGHDAMFLGDTTPIDVKSHYFVTLKGISVGEKILNIDPQIFKRNGVIIDSGASLTYFQKEAFYPFHDEVKNLIGNRFQMSFDYNNQLCYFGNMYLDLEWFSNVTLHFLGADLVLGAENVFIQREDDVFCFAVWERSQNIIGVIFQQYHNFAYDLDEGLLQFSRVDCELLDEYES